jgi:hypothetical protein
MLPKTKTALLFAMLIPGIICLSSFRPQVNASIVGAWTQTGIQLVTGRGNAPGDDTAIYHSKGYAIIFTADSQYHYTAPYNHKADGTYSIIGNILYQQSHESHSSEQCQIITLTEHKLITRTSARGLQSAVSIETTTTYSR